jgi:hypothetical protein
MSRSFKKAIITISKKLHFNVHRAVRKQVKQKLSKIDSENIDGKTLLGIEADTKEMGLEEYGTKLGWEFENMKEFAGDEDELQKYEEDRKRERRK